MSAGIDAKISTAHRAKHAVVYIRQSSPAQLVRNTGSTQSQYDLVKHVARLGWPPDLIRVMDQDQGQSAASAEHRVGFQELVAEVALGHIGLVCSLEVSRLARNNSDWYQLLDLCAVRRTLIADPEGVYDPALFNDRLLLGLRGTMSEAELHLLRARLDGGRLAKAQRGELRLRLPTGLIYNVEGEVVLDPDVQIQAAVRLVFERFRVLGSARAVVRHLRGKSIRLPSRQWDGGEAGRVEWREAEYGHVLRLLHNPRLAGTYVYGQRRTEPRVLTGGREVRHRLGPDEWRVVIPAAHPGYISWEEFLSNQERLAANSFSQGNSGVKRKGAALLQGLAVCGRCGRPMGVAYSGTGGKYPLYKCWHGRARMAQAPCQSVYAGYVDLAVAQAFLEAINPDAIELALAAFELAEQEARQVEQQWEMELARARYEAERAFRQYNKVEPENRLVARTLEARWEEALRAVQRLEHQQASAKQELPQRLTDQQRDRIRQMAFEVPKVWHAQSTTAADRKELLSLLLDRVVLARQAPRGAVEVTLHWKTGAQNRLMANIGRSHATNPQVVDRIRELAVDHTDPQIAARMDAEGWRTARGVDWTPRNVKNLRLAYDIREHCLAHPDGREGPRGDGCYSVNEAAKMLGVSRGTVIAWIHCGLLDATRDDPRGAWWVALTEDDRERLTHPAGCEGMVPLAEAAKRLDRPRSTVRNWIKTGRLDGRRVQLGRRTVWYVALPETQDPTEP